jgi:brefeldin A-inhibited guanine nucleotide-exchange protein
VTASLGSDTAEQLANVATKKQLFASGVKLFNAKPKKGMAYFIEHKFVENDVQAIAMFLKKTPQLGKPAIGDFIGEGDPENIQIMRAFIDTMEFDGKDFVEALRAFLQSFRLPGEAQKIDRLMEKFADRYSSVTLINRQVLRRKSTNFCKGRHCVHS